MKRGLLFDMDGTLWDSAANVAKSWNIALRQCGYDRPVLDEADMKRCMGKTMDVIAEMLIPHIEGAERARILQICCDVENDYLRDHGGVLYPEIRRTLEAVKAQGWHTYIVSNCQAGYIEAFLDYYKMWDLFEDIECFGNNGLTKDKNIRLLAERNGLDFSASYYVGDIQGDYDATCAAGLSFIHAAYGFGTVDADTPKIRQFCDLAELAARL